MNGLTQIEAITDAQGRLMNLVGLDQSGAVWFGQLTATGQSTYKVVWAVMEESVKR